MAMPEWLVTRPRRETGVAGRCCRVRARNRHKNVVESEGGGQNGSRPGAAVSVQQVGGEDVSKFASSSSRRWLVLRFGAAESRARRSIYYVRLLDLGVVRQTSVGSSVPCWDDICLIAIES